MQTAQKEMILGCMKGMERRRGKYYGMDWQNKRAMENQRIFIKHCMRADSSIKQKTARLFWDHFRTCFFMLTCICGGDIFPSREKKNRQNKRTEIIGCAMPHHINIICILTHARTHAHV